MHLSFFDPQTSIAQITSFVREVYLKQGKTSAVIAVSGGIDSAVSLSLLREALGAEYIFPLLLPYAEQNMDDARKIVEWNQIPQENLKEINIQPLVDQFADVLQVEHNAVTSQKRLGNIMARVRMILLFDLAKNMDALVCGTENKSEKYLAYFTRFGDEASDIEPIQHVYKTQVRQLAEHLGLPEIFLSKAPSAGLWGGQTDESEFGFTYEQADQVLSELIDKQKKESEISLDGIDPQVVHRVIDWVDRNHFKHEVPYVLDVLINEND